MNIQEYISSGIIESYVLDQLTPQERSEVEAMATKFPEVRNEINIIENTLINYARSEEKTPPSHLKSRILSQLDLNPSTPEAKIIPISSTKGSAFNWLVAAAIAVLLGSVFFNVLLFNRLDDTRSKLASATNEKEQFAKTLDQQKAVYLESQNQLAMIMKPEGRKIALKGLSLAPSSLATVFWDPASENVFINISSLPVPPSDKQYQLWAIVDGKPVDVGVFEITASENNSLFLQKMNSVANAQAFAVTLEKKGGSPSPTMEAMYLMGSV
ncbi:MAG: anti-sigma factor [Bacteroidota bacterium]|nr:anti-sigma factor [Bacteroidota bacterium]